MNIQELKQLIPLAHKANVTLAVVGPHGVGKSQTFVQYAKENDMKLVDLRLGQCDIGDLLGLADFKKDANGNNIKTEFKPPNWFPLEKNSKGILFLDEINLARQDVLQAVFQLVLDRKLHEMVLPKGWIVACAMNPDTEDYSVTSFVSEALKDRFLWVKFTPTNEEYFQYCESSSMNKDLLDFLRLNPEVLSAKLADFSLEVKPSKRSWSTVDRLLSLGLPQSILLETISGMVGMEAASQFVAYLEKNRDRPLSGTEILDSWSESKVRATKYATYTEGRHDLLTVSCDNLRNHIFATCKTTPLTESQTKALSEFINLLPIDIGLCLYKSVYLAPNDKNYIKSVCDILESQKDYLDRMLKPLRTPKAKQKDEDEDNA